MDKIEIEIRAKHRMSHIDVLSSYFSKIKNESFKSTIQQAFSVLPFTSVEAKAWVTCPSPYSKW